MIDLSVSIVNYNSREDLIKCLDSLRKGLPALKKYEVWVIDNASAESIRGLESLYGWARFVFNDKNIGFGAANNIAIRRADSRYHLIINPDIRVEERTIGDLIAFMDANEGIGIAGPKLVNEDGTLQYSCRRFPTLATFFARGLFPGRQSKVMDEYFMLDSDHSRALDVDWVLGSFMLCRKDMLNRLKGFDEKFFMYYEDIDLCYRARKAGSSVVYYPAAAASHTYKRESARGLNRLKFYHTLNAMRFFARYIGKRKWRTFG